MNFKDFQSEFTHFVQSKRILSFNISSGARSELVKRFGEGRPAV